MVFVTVTKYSNDFIMVESLEVAKRDHRTIHAITVDLQGQGYNLTSTCGNENMLVLVFHKEGIVEIEAKYKKEKKDKKKETNSNKI